MDLKKVLRISTIRKKKCLPPLLDGCCYCADVFVQYCRIDIFNRCLEVINEQGLDSSNWEFDPDPQEKVAEVAIRGCRGQKTSNTYKMILCPLRKFRIVSEQ